MLLFLPPGQKPNVWTCSRAHIAYCRFCPGLFPAVWGRWGGVVWGGLLTFMFTCSRGGCCVAEISCGVGWGGLIAFICTSTHTHTHIMLRCCTLFILHFHRHMSCYAAVLSLALPLTRHQISSTYTLSDPLLRRLNGKNESHWKTSSILRRKLSCGSF